MNGSIAALILVTGFLAGVNPARAEPPATAVMLPQCADGIDNDLDELIDYPTDPECDAATDESEDAAAPANAIAARWMLAVATSGSLNGNTCFGEFTGGDGSLECAGFDVQCLDCASTGCGNTLADDSRMVTVSAGLTGMIIARNESITQFALMRAHQTPVPLTCPISSTSSPSGGWQGAPTIACEDGYDTGDVLVSFSGDSQEDVLAYLNRQSDSGAPIPGTDFELRATGERPLGGMLVSAKDALIAARLSDHAGPKRHYGLVLLTDGASTCPTDAVVAATALDNAGFRTHVIGIATFDPADISALNAIAAAGGTGEAVFIADSAQLCQALVAILDDGITCDTLFLHGFE